MSTEDSQGTDRAAEPEAPSDRWSDRVDAPEGIVLYALGIYAFAFLFALAFLNVLGSAGVSRWVTFGSVGALMFGWGTALVGLVTLRTWGWVGSLAFHGLAFVVSMVAGDWLFVLILVASGFYVLSKGSLYLDDEAQARPEGA